MNDVALLQNRLESYRCTSAEEEMNALREMLQEMILAALSRTDFFTKAAFHGGTQLRIFEGVRRFSEDLDFALVSKDAAFDLFPYMEKIAAEMSAMGVELEVKDKTKASAAVRKGFLKNDSLVKILELRFAGKRGSAGCPAKISIKMEVDANPPSGATYCAAQLFFPFPASVRNFDRESAYEVLVAQQKQEEKRLQKEAEEEEKRKAKEAKEKERARSTSSRSTTTTRKKKSAGAKALEKTLNTTATTIGRNLGNTIVRSILGSIFKKK